MKNRTGEVAGGALGRMTRISYPAPSMHNHNDTSPVARTEELTNLLRLSIVSTGKQLLLETIPDRTESERNFLNDCARGRRVVSDETVRQLMAIQRRVDGCRHLFSEAMRGMELGLVPVAAECALDVSEQEQPIDAALDMAQIQAARDMASPARWQQVVDLGRRQIEVTRRLVDAACRQLATLNSKRGIPA